jgi:hypothetical protein
MLFYLQSTDPSCYQTVKFSTNVFAGSESLEFRIKQLATISTFLITTEDDYIIIEINGDGTECSEDATHPKPSVPGQSPQQHTIYFNERYCYNRDELAIELSTLFTNVNINVIDNDSGTLTFTSESEFIIIDASHRVKLLTGLYHTELPVKPTKHLKINSVPYTCYGNNLYLRSRISNIVGLNDSNNNEIYISICYQVLEILHPNMPVICRMPGNNIKINPTDLTNLEFTLVDFQNEPVLLKAPLNIVMEVFNTQIIENNVGVKW